MRRAIAGKLAGILDDDRRQIADRVRDFVRDQSTNIVTTVQEHVTAVADTTGTLAKQKLFHTLLSSGVMKSEHIRHALQLGIEYFLTRYVTNGNQSTIYIQRQKFPAAGGFTAAHDQTDFDIEAHGLQTFAALMNLYRIDSQQLKRDICYGELREILNPSSSGSLLYLTANSSYLIKTIRDYDVKFIQQTFLNEYFLHFQQHSSSYLAKLFGIYGYIPYLSQQRSISVDSFTLRFAIFSNFIPKSIVIHEKYDLKGSSYRRDADFNERLKSSATFKDNDFRHFHPNGFRLSRQIYSNLKEILIRDVDFLEKLNIMDYSLLLTIHNIDNPTKVRRNGALEAIMGTVRDTLLIGMNEQQDEFDRKLKDFTGNSQISHYQPQSNTNSFQLESIAQKHGALPARNEYGERVLIFAGIIDIFQTFDICKVMQRQYQTMENRDVVDERSIVEADFYARRFKEFVFGCVFHPIDDEPPNRTSVSSLYPSLSFL